VKEMADLLALLKPLFEQLGEKLSGGSEKE